MIASLQNLSLRWKLAFLIAATSSVVLGVAGMAFYLHEKETARREILADYKSLVEIAAANVTAAVAFNAKKEAKETLQTLAVRPDLRLAVIYDESGAVFAAFERDDRTTPEAPPFIAGENITASAIEVVHPITQAGETHGILYVRADLRRIEERLSVYRDLVVLVVALGALVSLAIATIVQRVISDPLGRLTDAARTVAQSKDFSIRVQKSSEDETGILIDSFNAMLKELQRQDHDLRQSEARFRTMADTSPVLIWVNDRNGCEFVNLQYQSFTGSGIEEIRGPGWTAFVHPEDLHTYTEAYRSAFRNAQRFEAPVRMRRADGEFRWLKSVGMPLFDADGSVSRFVGCSLDITEIKQYEQALQEADRRKDEFLAMLAHELRNPLGPIRNSAHAMRRIAAKDPVIDKLRDMIDRQVGHMSKLIDDLLDVSRITRGKILLHKEVLELSSLVRVTAEDYRSAFDERKIALAVRIPAHEIWVSGDRTRLAQCIGNLLHNAQKFTASGGHVDVRLESQGSHCVISVSDDGCGIDPKLRDRLFQPFAQGEQGIDRSRGGLGLGLALVKGLITLHGGEVSASSAGLGHGATFSIRLPVEVTRVPPETLKSEQSARQPRRILVVEDNVDAAESLRLLLEANGHSVEVANQGAAALGLARSCKPEVVLCDIGLPGMNGYDVCRQLSGEFRDTLFVAVTGYGQEEDQKQAREAGFKFHLTKPVDPDALERVINASATPTN